MPGKLLPALFYLGKNRTRKEVSSTFVSGILHTTLSEEEEEEKKPFQNPLKQDRLGPGESRGPRSLEYPGFVDGKPSTSLLESLLLRGNLGCSF